MTSRRIGLVLCCVLIGGCGLKGDLYLPEETEQAAPEIDTPVNTPESGDDRDRNTE